MVSKLSLWVPDYVAMVDADKNVAQFAKAKKPKKLQDVSGAGMSDISEPYSLFAVFYLFVLTQSLLSVK